MKQLEKTTPSQLKYKIKIQNVYYLIIIYILNYISSVLSLEIFLGILMLVFLINKF